MHENLNCDSLAKLHNQSYSKITDYYTELTDSMRNIRKDVLSVILEAKNIDVFKTSFIGPQRIGHSSLDPLPKTSSILDVGCATGDNLTLMQEIGFKQLTGLDVAVEMVTKAKGKLNIEFICEDFFQYKLLNKYDLVFAQAFVHLFPKKMLKKVLLRLLAISNRRVYFSTTIHETPNEGIEAKRDVTRYRSRYTLPEILKTIKEILDDDPNLSFHYFFLTDPLGKFWINAVFERHDIVQMMEADGVLLYKQFESIEQIDLILPEIDTLRAVKPEVGTILRYDSINVFDRVENIFPYCSKDLKNILYSTKVHKIVSMLMQEDAVLLKDKINYKLPGSGEFVPHQDAAAGWGEYGNKQLTFALSFDEANLENGALYFACGAHKKGLLSPLQTPLSDDIVNNLHWDAVLMNPGDALFFNALAPHFSKPNTSDKPRRMAFLTYNSAKFGDHRESFFIKKRKRQPPIDERNSDAEMIRDPFGKLIYKQKVFYE